MNDFDRIILRSREESVRSAVAMGVDVRGMLLTPFEVKVCKMAASTGKSAHEIASELKMSNKYPTNIYRALKRARDLGYLNRVVGFPLTYTSDYEWG